MSLLVLLVSFTATAWIVIRQIRSMLWENTIRSLAEGLCPRCHAGAYSSSCPACGGSGSAESYCERR